MIYQAILFILLTTAGFLLCRQLLKIPKLSMRKNVKNLQAEKEKPGKQLLDRFIMPFVRPVSKIIPLDPVKEARMAAMLRRGGLELTPKEYQARAILCALCTLPLALLFLAIGAPNLAPLVLLFALLLYRHFTTDLKDAMKEKKRRIEAELPGFIRSILYRLEDNKHDGSRITVQADLIEIFEDYLRVASQAFYGDVAILIVDMKAGHRNRPAELQRTSWLAGHFIFSKCPDWPSPRRTSGRGTCLSCKGHGRKSEGSTKKKAEQLASPGKNRIHSPCSYDNSKPVIRHRLPLDSVNGGPFLM